MMTFGETQVEIIKTDNGYILTWQEKEVPNRFPPILNKGVQVFTSLADVLDRSKEVLK